jgi:hypothetical protein
MTAKNRLLAALLATTLMSSTGAFAQANTGSGPNPFSDCGVGAALFPETKWAAVTSNIIWDIGITGIVSATASPQTCSGKKVAAAVFISNTYASLAEEAAAGQGEHLASVLNIMECNAARHDAAIANVRDAMTQVVASPAYAEQSRIEKASKFYDIVETAVSASCSV